MAEVDAHRQEVKRNKALLYNGVMYCKLLTPEEEAKERKEKDRRVILDIVTLAFSYLCLSVAYLYAVVRIT
jgi:hypothetical protein